MLEGERDKRWFKDPEIGVFKSITTLTGTYEASLIEQISASFEFTYSETLGFCTRIKEKMNLYCRNNKTLIYSCS